VTFLFSDVEGSTRLWESHGEEMRSALAVHDEIVRAEIEGHGGYVFATGGDGYAAAFARAADALAAAAAAAQARLLAVEWARDVTVRVRMGLHTGEVEERNGDYFGSAVNEAARLMAIGHGGQVLCSAVTAGLVGQHTVVDLGEHRLRDLSSPRRVFQVGEEKFPPLRSLDAFRTNLPVQVTRFVGRVEELGRVADALGQSRLVTLTGVGGVGKTRLALQAAADALPSFPDGVWLVEQAGLVEPAMVADTVAAVLGVPVVVGRPVPQALAAFLRGRCLLVVLDNCEHLIEAAAELVEQMLSAGLGCRVLATSREGLAVPGERVVPVPPMSVGGEDLLSADAVRLFVERASEARDGFVVGDQDAPVLAGLCRRLDGIPLAIELAAARVRSMTPAEILAHLDQRFRLLSAGRRTAPTRQQTLRGAIDWSHGLLEEPERALLRRLAVFTGGFDLDAAVAVVSDEVVVRLEVFGLVDRLVDKSLLVAEAAAAVTRYRLLETIRDYGLERLEEAGETLVFAARHAEHFVELAERAGPGLRGPDEERWNRVVEAELENLRAALRWAIDTGRADLAVRLVAGLAVNGPRMGMPFGAAAADAAHLQGASGNPLSPLCLASAARSARWRGDFEEGEALSVEALDAGPVAAGGDTEALRVRSVALDVAIGIRMVNGDTGPEVTALFEESLAVTARLSDPFYLAHAWVHGFERSALEESVRYARMSGNPSFLAHALILLAQYVAAEEPLEAKATVEEALGHAASVGNEQAAGLARRALMLYAPGLGGDYVTAAQILLDSAERALAIGERFFAFQDLLYVAFNLDALGADECARLVAAWIIHQGIDFRAAALGGWVAVGHAKNLAEQLSDATLGDLLPQIATMSDAGVIALCRAAIDQHLPD
jgi:predicted ATPase/class 3 adenylate cyclase